MSLAAMPAAMRYTPRDDLPILSAEIYSPGLAGLSYSGSTRTSKKPLAVRTSDATQEGPRKRAKAQPAQKKDDEHNREEEEKKRTRGRPRLDVKDETAADRRRTQIRLAQRAYRNRKENAIQTLEKRVQDLKDANEEMSNVFMQLHDFAVNTGALDHNPELGRQLRMTTEKFLALARKASEDGGKDDEGEHGSPESPNTGDSIHAGNGRSSSPEAVDVPRSEPSTEKPKPLLWGGYSITHEIVNEPNLVADFASNSLPPRTDPALDFEIITQPTPENASFPFGTAPGFDFTGIPTPSPYSSLSVPTSYSSREITFGRRLHRFATERALWLISMPNPPPEKYNRVFGFCLLLETREAIHARTRRTVQKNIQESLAYWPYPFHNLGGTGTHFDATSIGNDMPRYGNQGTMDIMKPAAANGFSTGPFTPEIAEVQDSVLDKDMRMEIPGFGGDFFDPEEVELYLRQRGVLIPAGVDHVTADVDVDSFGGNPTAAGAYGYSAGDFGSLGQSTVPTTTSMDHGSTSIFASSSGTSSSGMSPSSSSIDGGSGSTATTVPSHQPPTSGWDFGSGSNSLVDPLLSGMFSQASTSYMSMGTPTVSAPAADFMGFSTQARKRATVVLDVNLMIRKMTDRATCLGRAPGFRQESIHAAFWEATRVIS